eukprot:gnl/TRDRNA2_/TRDRNA2_187664_c0_seq1.p1 gnl/TRDRNA2_/TRDRNA2_187664_c0~~gnl/TRDRNA2_/TRDRNA2_187664_c0_seq1.p1  ORF type:complete len:626 (-),score=103.22 gnl/TRDRNA2_/TRDRNA2_187664_c0_seq1:98-1975(-)
MSGGIVVTSPAGGRNDVHLEQRKASPLETVSSLGSGSFQESFRRHSAEHYVCKADDSRHERLDHGLVKWRTESSVPDIGGLGWRTRANQEIKNQSYYSQGSHQNLWDMPNKAGHNTWSEWHGPRMRTDAPMMAALDTYDSENDQWNAKKLWVNTSRIQTLDRFYNQKLRRTQLESASSWAPDRHARCEEVEARYQDFSTDLKAMPLKALKQVMTDSVLKKDREAVRQICNRMQCEETWKMAWRHMEQERRFDILADFQQRQLQTDILMQMSGQPVREKDTTHYIPHNCSQREEELARPKKADFMKDVTDTTDFRGLLHADHGQALEGLMPGYGYELYSEFKARATESAKGGWPPPGRAQTPTREELGRADLLKGKGGSRSLPSLAQDSLSMSSSMSPRTLEFLENQSGSPISKASIPTSALRLGASAGRLNDQVLMKHAMIQVHDTSAPPAPGQKDTVLQENWKPITTTQDPARVTGTFARTDHGFVPTLSKVKGGTRKNGEETADEYRIIHRHPNQSDIPVPTRPYYFPMLAKTSPKAKSPNLSPTMAGESPQGTPVRRQVSSPALLSPVKGRRGGPPKDTASDEPTTQAVCQQLDLFEASISPQPRISNFFAAPQPSAKKLQY